MEKEKKYIAEDDVPCEMSEEKLKKALYKKALGYSTQEVIEEYAIGEDGEYKLTKKKVTKKHMPPDITSVKTLLEHMKETGSLKLDMMTDEELEAEKQRLLELLKNEND